MPLCAWASTNVSAIRAASCESLLEDTCVDSFDVGDVVPLRQSRQRAVIAQAREIGVERIAEFRIAGCHRPRESRRDRPKSTSKSR
jgi:hypothetical protein